MEEFDFNGDGAIDFEEFLLLMAEQMAKPGKYLFNNSSQHFIIKLSYVYDQVFQFTEDESLSNTNLMHAFETFDQDSDGFITKEELKNFFHQVQKSSFLLK